MSVIAGIYERGKAHPDPLLVMRMIDSMSYRANDGSRLENPGSVCLAHAMLHTTPESLQESQPLYSLDRQLCLTADARVDNRDELICELDDAETMVHKQATDADLILAAYQTWGDECPRRIIGDFAFAIWDQPKRRLFCARDPVGIKPFFYHASHHTFRWASEPAAFFQDSTISREPNLRLLGLYLLNYFYESEETLYKNILRLPGGHFLVVTSQEIKRARYWDVDARKTIQYQSASEYSEHFLSLFRQAVKSSIRSCAPVGSQLSGGLDSSSIVCTAQLLSEKEPFSSDGLETFSAVFGGLPCDERRYIQAVIDQVKPRANYFEYENNHWGCDVEEITQYRDVLYLPTLFIMAPAFQVAQNKGIRVMLSGLGGDDFLETRLEFLTDLMLQRRFRQLIPAFKDLSRLYSRSPASLFFNFCLKPVIPKKWKVAVKRILRSQKESAPFWMNPVKFRSLKAEGHLKMEQIGQRFDSHAKQHIYESVFSRWTGSTVFDTNDRFGARFSLERRYPFFDRRLIEFFFALPEEQRWSHGISKGLLRRAMKNILPEAVRRRNNKAEFSCFIRMEIGNRQIQKTKKIIGTSRLAQYGLLEQSQMDRLFENYLAGRDRLAARSLERIMAFELWFRAAFAQPDLEGLTNGPMESKVKPYFENNRESTSKTLFDPCINVLRKHSGVDPI